MLWFKLDYGDVSELSFIHLASLEQKQKGEKDSVKKYRAVFDVGNDKYSDSVHIDDSGCTFSFRIGKNGNKRVWKLTHYGVIGGTYLMNPELYCANARAKWEEPRAFIKIFK